MSHNAQVINGVEPDVLSQYAGVPGRPMILIGRGESNAYANSGATSLGTGSTLYFYDSAPLNSITNATLTGASGWYSSVTLPVGTYLIRGYFSALFSATGSLTSGFYAGGYIGSQGMIGGSVNANYDGGGYASASVTITVSTTFSLRVYSSTNVSAVASQGTVPSQESWLIIEKLA